MKSIPALAVLLLFGQPLFLPAQAKPTITEEKPAEPAQPAGKKDAADPNLEDQRPQPPQQLAKITKLTAGDKDGISWGETQNGLAIGVGKISTSLKSPVRPTIEVYLENRGMEKITRDTLRLTALRLKLNDNQKPIPGLGNPFRLTSDLEPGQRLGPFPLAANRYRTIQILRIAPAFNLNRLPNRARFELTEGDHTLNFEFFSAWRQNAGLLASNTVKIKVAMVPYPVDKAVAMIHNGLNNENPTTRRNSALLAGQLGLSGTRDALITALKDADAITRRYSAQSLGELKDPAAVEPLKPLVQDQEMVVRLEAVNSLISLGEESQLSWFEPIIRSKQTSVYQIAIRLARETFGKKAVPMLIGCLDFDDPSTENRYNFTLVQQIGLAGGPRHKYNRTPKARATREQVEENQKTLLKLKAMVVRDL